jgi:hypothetical protein
MKRVVQRMMPDGQIIYLWPFHVSLEGLETAVLCRDEDDYDAMVKMMCVCAKRKNVIIVIYAAVSNHCHVAVLAQSQKAADDYGQEVKRMYAMWISRKYGEKQIMHGVDVKAMLLDSDWYLRNALAYIPRNALDNGCNVNDYKWSGYRAMFGKDRLDGVVRVSSLSKSDRQEIMHTGDSLKDVPWMLDKEWHLVPSSFCDHAYLEQAFDNDQAFFIKTIGGQNSAEMKNKLVDQPRKIMPDTEYYKTINEISNRWFKTDLSNISEDNKIKILPYVYRTTKTTVPQLARVFGMNRKRISGILGKVQF